MAAFSVEARAASRALYAQIAWVEAAAPALGFSFGFSFFAVFGNFSKIGCSTAGASSTPLTQAIRRKQLIDIADVGAFPSGRTRCQDHQGASDIGACWRCGRGGGCRRGRC